MLKPTGSVYLDTPRPPSRRPPIPRVNNTRVLAAGVLTVVGLVGLTVATIAIGVRTMILPPEPIVEAVDASYDDSEARAELEAEVAASIVSGFVGVDLAEATAAFGIDVPAEADLVAGPVVDDPAFRTALTDLVVEVHRRSLLEPAEGEVDLAPMSNAALAVIREESPVLDALIPDGSVLWRLESSTIPDLAGPMAVLDRALVLALMAALGVPLAAVVHPRHHRVAAWLGRWALVAGLLAALTAVGLPPLAGHLTGWTMAESASRHLGTQLLAPAGLAAVVGMGLVSVAAVARRREARRVIEEGAAAALGVEEPASWPAARSPQLDLARRGLVDVEHPLTNI